MRRDCECGKGGKGLIGKIDGGGVGVGGGSGRLGNFEIYLLLFRACECLVAFRVRQLHSSVTIVDVHRQLNMLLSLRSG